jgi:hypothetical protein
MLKDYRADKADTWLEGVCPDGSVIRLVSRRGMEGYDQYENTKDIFGNVYFRF